MLHSGDNSLFAGLEFGTAIPGHSNNYAQRNDNGHGYTLQQSFQQQHQQAQHQQQQQQQQQQQPYHYQPSFGSPVMSSFQQGFSNAANNEQERRHSYAGPTNSNRPQQTESMFFSRSSSVSNPAGFNGMNIASSQSVSPPTSNWSLWNSTPNINPTSSPTAMYPTGGNANNAILEDTDFFLPSTSPQRRPRRFSFDHDSRQPQMTNDMTALPIGSHLLACDERDDENPNTADVGSPHKYNGSGSYGGIIGQNTGFGNISPVSSNSSTLAPSSSVNGKHPSKSDKDETIIDNYFVVDKLGRNSIVNDGLSLPYKPDPYSGPRSLSNGFALPSPPFTAYDIDASSLINAPSNRLCFVQFKSARTDVFHIADSNKLNLNVGDYVIVDADRGRDLGKVVKPDVSREEAGLLKIKRHQEQQAILQNLPTGSPMPSLDGHSSSNTGPGVYMPKQIMRFAQKNEIEQILYKQNDEETALAMCLQKVNEKGLSMSVLDAEYQWDRRKLTFFYSADHRIDFRDLVRELFRIYKTRIWMCAVGSGSTVGNLSSPVEKPQVSTSAATVPQGQGQHAPHYGLSTSQLFQSPPLVPATSPPLLYQTLSGQSSGVPSRFF